MAGSNQPEVHRGLKDLCFDRSPTTLIDGRAGELRYRGYSIHDLATRSSFEETAFLLLHGELPTRAELDAFDGCVEGGPASSRRHPRHHPRGRRCASDGRAPHRGFRACRVRPGDARQLARRDPAQGDPAHLPGTDDRRRPSPPPAWPGAGVGENRPRARRELSPHAQGRGPERGCGLADGHRHGAARRARVERFVVHREGRRQHRCEPARRHHLGRRSALRPGPRRRGGERHAHGEGDRRSVPGRRLRQGKTKGARADHGLRPPGLPGRGPARPAHARRG